MGIDIIGVVEKRDPDTDNWIVIKDEDNLPRYTPLFATLVKSKLFDSISVDSIDHARGLPSDVCEFTEGYLVTLDEISYLTLGDLLEHNWEEIYRETVYVPYKTWVESQQNNKLIEEANGELNQEHSVCITEEEAKVMLAEADTNENLDKNVWVKLLWETPLSKRVYPLIEPIVDIMKDVSESEDYDDVRFVFGFHF